MVVANILNMITNNTCKGNCSRCGECCNPYNPITLDEYFEIKKYIQEHNIKPYIPTPKGNDIYLTCCFHDVENKCCTIYPVRPEVCRRFSCHNSDSIINNNRTYYDKRADINGHHLDRFVPFDLLFYDHPLTAILIAYSQLKADTPKKLSETLHKMGADRDFFDAWQLPSCYDIAEAIEKGQITLDWRE